MIFLPLRHCMTLVRNMSKIAALSLAMMLSACSVTPTTPITHLQVCQQQLHSLQQLTRQHHTRDAQYIDVQHFSTYRSNRFWSAFDIDAMDEEQLSAWRKQLHTLGMQSLNIEWQNLPADAKQKWKDQHQLDTINAFMQRCDAPLFQASLQHNVKPADFIIPDSYSSLQRFFGLYTITQHGAASSIAEYQADMRNRFETFQWDEHPKAIVYRPTESAPLTNAKHWLAEASRNHPLQVPVLSESNLLSLAQFHAPALRIHQQSAADRIGKAQWKNGERIIQSNEPVVYFNSSYIRYQNRILLQLNYTAWFSERPKPSEYDWYGGKLDGLMWRVTLQANGDVLFYDSIHPCGCYHSVHIPKQSPLRHQLLQSQPEGQGESILEPILFFTSTLPSQTAQPLLTMEPATHYLVAVAESSSDLSLEPNVQPYRLEPYDQLRALSNDEGFQNWFDEDGIIASSKRFERFFLWPLGVPNAGAMRQQGHHAIAFVGKRHFDEPSVERLLGL
jgi:hypothetical protein